MKLTAQILMQELNELDILQRILDEMYIAIDNGRTTACTLFNSNISDIGCTFDKLKFYTRRLSTIYKEKLADLEVNI